MRFSVVICTYNRAHLVRQFLPTVLNQQFDQTDYEVIVVDNNSSDNIKQVVAEMQATFPHLRYQLEGKQGLSHARNCGWQAARGEYVAYLDDECKVPAAWLTHAQTIIDQHAPLSFGGEIAAFIYQDPPIWWRESYNREHHYEQGDQACYLDRGQTLFGGNLFVRRDILHAVGGFDPTYGMRGKTVSYGEESELLERITATYPGQLPYYDPQLIVYHLIRPDKMSLRWTFRKIAGYNKTYQKLNKSDAPYLSRFDALRLMAYIPKEGIVETFNAFFHRDKQVHPHWQTYLYESKRLHQCATQWGHLAAHYELKSWR